MAPRKDQIVAGKYRLREPLAHGGMGAVWVARHIELDVDVAIKFRAAPDELDASAVARFKREAQAAARLKSPHVVHIYDYGVDEGVPYIAMELLEGEDLGDLLDRVDYLPLGRTAELVGQAARGLECAHEAHIVHRDVKPRNLFLARQGTDEVLKILDFGIAKHTRGAVDDGNTSANVILGSPNYMSPEQARGAELDASSDVWSLAAVAYRALTGVPPFAGQNSQDTVIKICTESAPRPTAQRAGLPNALDALFERALARKPEERFASPTEFARALASLSKQHPETAEPTAAQAPSAPKKGRSDPTETLASPAAELRDDSAPRAPVGRRAALVGALLAGLVLAYALVRQEPRELPAPAPTPAHRDGPVAPPPTALRVPIEEPPPAATAHDPTPPEPGVPARTAAPKTLPEPHSPPPPVKQLSRQVPQAPAPKAPTVDPVFGLPVAPTASAKP